MNKAFVREIEEKRDCCPQCGSTGIAVFAVTLQAWLTAEQRQQLSDVTFFCVYKNCPVAYFDSFERMVPAEELAVPIWPKAPEAPVCQCSGLTLRDIEEDVEASRLSRIRETVAHAQSGKARCSSLAPSGQNCTAAVQKCYMQVHRQ
ncbi:MAG: hypothetical protein VB858_09735 [Planctomycetaceae bacterium]